jgi:Tol biopolymer transport system component
MPAKGNVVYASGYLIYLREKTLMAQLFDVDRLEISGDAVPVAEPVEYDLTYNRVVFSASQNGILIYQSSTTQSGYWLEWFDRNGTLIGKIAEPADYGSATFSPDGKKIAFDLYDPHSRKRDIWIYDIARELKTRLTFDPGIAQFPVWSPDGSRILFHSDRLGHYDIFQKAANGAGVDEVLLESPFPKFAYDWSSDGRFIAYSTPYSKTKSDLWILPLVGDRKPFLFLQTEFEEDVPKFSSDMRWISYASNESGRWELYVRPFMGADGKPVINQTGKWQVSTNGLSLYSYNFFWWNRNGKEIFYYSMDNKLMTTEIRATGLTLDIGATKPVFNLKEKGQIYFYDVTANGQKFLMGIPVGGQHAPPLTLVTNWDSELKKK